MEDLSDQVAAFYDQNAGTEWSRMERHPTEYKVTLRLLSEHLPPPPARILDCGGGPGRYAIELARRGYDVVLFDLSDGNLRLADAKAGAAGITLAGIEQGTALDLSRFPAESFDAVLLMGPLYHLLKLDQRRRAVIEAKRVLRSGGKLFATFIGRYAAHMDAAVTDPLWVLRDPDQAEEILTTGRLLPRESNGTEFVSYFAHPDEVEDLFWEQGLAVQGTWGVEGLIGQAEASVNALEPEAFNRWLAINYRVSTESCLRGACEHMLVISIKPAWKTALKKIVRVLKDNNVIYTIVGGASVALNGVRIPVRDVDIEMDADSAYRFQELFIEQAIEPVSYRASENYRSHFGRFEIDGIGVEVMGDLQRKADAGWVNTWALTRHPVNLEGEQVDVSWLEEETLAYIRRGRLERAAQCLPHCDPSRLLELMRRQRPVQVL